MIKGNWRTLQVSEDEPALKLISLQKQDIFEKLQQSTIALLHNFHEKAQFSIQFNAH